MRSYRLNADHLQMTKTLIITIKYIDSLIKKIFIAFGIKYFHYPNLLMFFDRFHFYQFQNIKQRIQFNLA